MKNITKNSMRYRSIYIKRKIFTASLILLIFFIFSIPTIASDADTIVYVTDTGKKYHVAGCGYLSRSCNEITLSEAVKAGKTPCSRCNPPILNETPNNEENHSNNATHSRPYTVEDVKRIIANSDQISESKKAAQLRDDEPESNTNDSIESEKWDPDSDRTVYLENEIFHLKECPVLQENGILRSLCFLTKEVQPCNYCQPLKYTTIKDVPGYEEPKEKGIGIIEIIGIVALFIWVIWIGYILLSCISFIKDKIQNKLKSKNTEKNLKLKEAERAQAEYEFYFSCYAFYPHESFVDIPKGVFLKYGLPATAGRGKYGQYTVYVTPKGKCYHQKELCLKSPNLKQTHFIFMNGHLRPCSKCAKKTLPDLNWYYEYKRISDIKKKYLIP